MIFLTYKPLAAPIPRLVFLLYMLMVDLQNISITALFTVSLTAALHQTTGSNHGTS